MAPIMKLVTLLACSAAVCGNIFDIHVSVNKDEVDESNVACYWDGTSPFCAGDCPSGYEDCGHSDCGDGACCWTGTKAYCCKGGCHNAIPNPGSHIIEPVKPKAPNPEPELDAANCYWDGTSPFCAGSCPRGYDDCAHNDCGDGACCLTGSKAYCCKGTCPNSIPKLEAKVPEPTKPKPHSPEPELDAANCYWDGTSPFCAGDCPRGYEDCGHSDCGDGACCWTGSKAYCCKGGCPNAASGLEPKKPKLNLPEPSRPHGQKPIHNRGGGDYDDICDPDEEILCCPPGASKNEDCKCVQVPALRLGGRRHSGRTLGDDDDDLCEPEETLCCNPGAHSNDECGCIPPSASFREL